MARKIEKRSNRRAFANGEVKKVVERKNSNYEESLAKLKADAWKWGLFFICMILIWFITHF